MLIIEFLEQKNFLENINKFGNHQLLLKLANAYNAVPTSNGFTLAGKIETTGHEYGSGGSWHQR